MVLEGGPSQGAGGGSHLPPYLGSISEPTKHIFILIFYFKFSEVEVIHLQMPSVSLFEVYCMSQLFWNCASVVKVSSLSI